MKRLLGLFESRFGDIAAAFDHVLGRPPSG